ncbi:MAG: uncharacterized protein A8A55_1478, partial [Amphiamblys sp. WSBS2006]
MKELVLDAEKIENITEILKAENNSIWVGKVGTLHLKGYAVEILTKLRIPEENILEVLDLNTNEHQHLMEILKEENNSIWVGKVKNLSLGGHITEILPKLIIHKENEMETFVFDTGYSKHFAETPDIENNSIWVGKVGTLHLKGYAVDIFTKLRIPEENVLEELSLNTNEQQKPTEILKEENNSIWVGKMRKLELSGYAVEILPRLIIHEENEMEELDLRTGFLGQITEILRMKNKSLWVGKVKVLKLRDHTIKILPKLGFHKENQMKVLSLFTDKPSYIVSISREENKSIWVGKVEKLELYDQTVEILPKLRIHKENVMEELFLSSRCYSFITEILKEEKNSIWVGKVKVLKLEGYTLGILPKLRIHEENEMEKLFLGARCYSFITEILKTKDKSVWVGRVKRLELSCFAIEILPKLRFHGENVMEKLVLSADKPEEISEILKTKDKSVWVGKVKKVRLEGLAKKIE